MKGILIASQECTPCQEMKDELKPFIESGEIELVEFEKDPERVTKLVNDYHAGIPQLLILSNTGEIIASI